MKRLLVLAACLGALAVPAPAMAACAGENDIVTAANLNASAAAMACLVNDYRTAKGLNAMVDHNILAASGLAHSNDMVDRGYFSHFADPPAGFDPQARDVALGYPSSAGVGENIGFRGPTGTPAQMFADFQASSTHNANMLNIDWTAAGYGFALGNPGLGDGVVVSQEFGTSTSGAGSTPDPGCPKADRLAAKLKRLKKNNASKSKISKTKKALKKARKACK
jgi:uncharacterized protein YkwD